MPNSGWRDEKAAGQLDGALRHPQPPASLSATHELATLQLDTPTVLEDERQRRVTPASSPPEPAG
jgi:hypothetical protein